MKLDFEWRVTCIQAPEMIRKKIKSTGWKSVSLVLMVAMVLVLAIFYTHSSTVVAQNPTISLDAPVSFPVDI